MCALLCLRLFRDIVRQGGFRSWGAIPLSEWRAFIRRTACHCCLCPLPVGGHQWLRRAQESTIRLEALEEKAAEAFVESKVKAVRYIVGIIGFLLVWCVVAVVIGAIMAMVFPRSGEHSVMVGIGLDWRNIPGTILGALAGLQSFRASIKESKKR